MLNDILGRRKFLCLPALACGAKAAIIVDVAAIDRTRILNAAQEYLREQPRTITSATTGGPIPRTPRAPTYSDGMSNPDNFDAHRQALMRLNVQAPALAAAWKITKDMRYSAHALRHLRALFVDPE